jgi:signal transduction histidine kinase
VSDRLATIRLRIVAFAAALQVVLALAMPALFQHLLRLTDTAARSVRWGFVALVPLSVVVTMVAADVALKGTDTRARVLQAPFRLSLALLGCEVLALTGMTAALLGAGTPLPLDIGLALCSAAVMALPPVPLYAFARVMLLPVALELGDENPPAGRRVSLALSLGYGMAAVAAASLVPAAVFGAAQLDVAAAEDGHARAQLTAQRLVAAAAELDVTEAQKLILHTPLPGQDRTILRAPSGTMLPEDVAVELQDRPYVELPLGGALRGGALRVLYLAQPIARAPILVATLSILALGLLIAAAVGSAVARDVASVTTKIDRIARDLEPGPPRPVATAEIRRLLRATNRILERIPRFTVESFLAIERAEEAQRLKSQFLANMSHDLRSPLNSILGFSELLLRGIEGKISDRQRAQLEVIQSKGNHLLRLLTEILDTAKLESGRMELHRHSAPPAELLRAALQEARRGRSTDPVQVALQPGMAPIHVDPLRTTQAMTHLINYALDAVADSQGTVRLSAAERDSPSGKSFVIELEHDGDLGDSDESQLFDGFRRVGRAGLHLALPLAKRLVELHDGSVELVARKPAKYRLILPLPGPAGRSA